MAFVAGPGFAVGAGTAVSPAGTQLGVIPGVPVLGALPESSTPWLLLLALLPVALGALAGWITRSRLAAPTDADAAAAPCLRQSDAVAGRCTHLRAQRPAGGRRRAPDAGRRGDRCARRLTRGDRIGPAP